MPLFQSSVITKHLQNKNKEVIAVKWESFKNHFHNPKVQEEIKSLKEEQYQGEFLEDFFVKILGYTKPASSSETKFNLTTECDGAIIVNNAVKTVIELKGFICYLQKLKNPINIAFIGFCYFLLLYSQRGRN